jgi:hypothetical protein
LIGADAFVALDLNTWQRGEKSAQVLLGKRVIAFPDVRLKPGKWFGNGNYDPGGLDHISKQWLLSITAGDSVSIPRLWDVPWRGRLPGKVWLASNETPNLNDPILPGRFVKLAFRVSFKDREDFKLLDKLRAELPGIAQRAVAGYHRLCRRGRFIQPASGTQLGTEVEGQSDPFTEFMLETFIPDPEGTVPIWKFRDTKNTWAARRGHIAVSKIDNRHMLENIHKVRGFLSVARGTNRRTLSDGKKEPWSYTGLRYKTAEEQEEG